MAASIHKSCRSSSVCHATLGPIASCWFVARRGAFEDRKPPATAYNAHRPHSRRRRRRPARAAWPLAGACGRRCPPAPVLRAAGRGASPAPAPPWSPCASPPLQPPPPPPPRGAPALAARVCSAPGRQQGGVTLVHARHERGQGKTTTAKHAPRPTPAPHAVPGSSVRPPRA
jgi:hypothetical protein